MYLNRVVIPAAVSKILLLIAVCLFLSMSLFLSGCSEAEEAKEAKKEKPVVTDMKIEKPDEGSAEKKAMEPKKDEVESLPMESDSEPAAAEEEKLPALGTGG